MLKQRRYPINHPIHHACDDAVDKDGTGDGKHFGAQSQNIPSAAVNVGHSVSKKSCIFFDIVIYYLCQTN